MPWIPLRLILFHERRRRRKAEARIRELEARLDQQDEKYAYRMDLLTNCVINARGPVNGFIKGVKEPEHAKPQPVSPMFVPVPRGRENEWDAAYEQFRVIGLEPSVCEARTREYMGLADNVKRNVV